MISDAGTPSISDPGTILVNNCIKNDIEIFSIPGPSSVTSAISISGFSEKFFFYGFLPEKKKILEKDLETLSNINASIIFFVSSKKINNFVSYFKKFFSDRKIVICREMTKFYEEYLRTDIINLDKINLELRGELTIVLSEKKLDNKTSQNLSESDKRIISKMINKISVKEIVSMINQNKKISKKEIYNYCIKLKDDA